MSHYHPVPEGKDPLLWEIARKRAGFKNHVATYLIINLFLWALWYFTGQSFDEMDDAIRLPWPAWTTIGWGIGLAFHFAGAYLFPKVNTAEKEYEKLINKK